MRGIRKSYILFPLFFCISLAVYEPGQPGDAWSPAEIDVVREKIVEMIEPLNWYKKNRRHNNTRYTGQFIAEGTFNFKEEIISYERVPKTSRLIQLAFHDCLRYTDGTGGCDGCLNWNGMDFFYKEAWLDDKVEKVRSYPVSHSTSNAGLTVTVKALELIYKNTSWPSNSRALNTSLFDSGKSRADLWAFAGQVALELEIERANFACDKDYNTKQQVAVLEGREKCDIKLHRAFFFKTGRKDCISDNPTFPYKATKEERHANPWGQADSVLKDLKRDFDFTARESISLMAVHSIQPNGHNEIIAAKYRWIGLIYLSNMYYKQISGRPLYSTAEPLWFDPSRDGETSFVSLGDVNGAPVAAYGWKLWCKGMWNATWEGGPCYFRPTRNSCLKTLPDNEMARDPCFRVENGTFVKLNNPPHVEKCCRNATLDPVTHIQTGGCKKRLWDKTRCMTTFNYAFNYEMNFYHDFTVDENNRPRGCPGLNTNMRNMTKMQETELLKCGRTTYAPEGETTSSIVDLFADDHDLWAEQFLNAWEKMIGNGYTDGELVDGPQNGLLGYGTFLRDHADFEGGLKGFINEYAPVSFTNTTSANPKIDSKSPLTFRDICNSHGSRDGSYQGNLSPGLCPNDF